MPAVTLQDALELSAHLEKRGRHEERALVDFHAFAQYKEAAEAYLPPLVDSNLLTKLAAVIRLDDVLVEELNKSAAADRETTKACLLLNRRRGVDILRQVLK
jgi:hypothetical protein